MPMTYNRPLPSPRELKEQYPLPPALAAQKDRRDREIRAVFQGESRKFLVIVGPCSADREDAVLEYCQRLAELQRQVGERLLLIPRVYTNKPRTTGEGYKGMLHQPSPDKAPRPAGGHHRYPAAAPAGHGGGPASPPPTRCSTPRTAAIWTTFSPTRPWAPAPWRTSSTGSPPAAWTSPWA